MYVYGYSMAPGLWSRSQGVGVGEIFNYGVGVEVGVGISKKIGVRVGDGSGFPRN